MSQVLNSAFQGAVTALLEKGFKVVRPGDLGRYNLQVAPLSTQRVLVNPQTGRAIFLDKKTGAEKVSCGVTENKPQPA